MDQIGFHFQNRFLSGGHPDLCPSSRRLQARAPLLCQSLHRRINLLPDFPRALSNEREKIGTRDYPLLPVFNRFGNSKVQVFDQSGLFFITPVGRLINVHHAELAILAFDNVDGAIVEVEVIQEYPCRVQ